MEHEATLKVFGQRRGGVAYRPRRAAYAVIEGDGGMIATVGHKGNHFLPGGGCHEGETPEETLVREVREELTREVRILGRMGEAVQYFVADGCDYRMTAVFFRAEFVGEPTGQGEHQLCWLKKSDIEAAFFHQCHAWAAAQI